jgi:putative transposase
MSGASFIGRFSGGLHMAGFEVATHGRFWVAAEGKKHRTFIWSYSLMGNHVHHIAVPEREDSLAETIKEAHGEYTTYFNFKYGLVGHAWQERFKSFPMDEAYYRNAIRYVECNPVRAGIVKRAEDYLWSSAAARCGLRDDLLLSGNCPFVIEIENWSEWLAGTPVEAANDVIRRHTQTGRALGSSEFLIRAGLQIGRNLLPQKRGPKSKRNQPATDSNEESEPPVSSTLFG